MKKLLSSISFAIFAFLSLSAEDCGESHFIKDSGFDIWCGEELCDWKLERGAVQKSSTWHKDDYSVEFVGDDVVISQLSTRSGTPCLRFELLADIEDTARVTLTMDFYDDGIVDYTQELAHVQWESLVYYVSTPATWTGVRFTLHKEGPGRARVAQIQATVAESCFDNPLELPNRPFGATCASGADCKSGLCADPVTPTIRRALVCSGCDTAEDCGLGEVCGVGQEAASFLPPTRNCIPEASRPLGSQCLSATECGNGYCNLGVCSECRAASDCPSGESCRKAAHPELIAERVAALCSGKEPGATCAGDGDCDSGICQGGAPVQVCALDGRDCIEDADCPYSSLQINLCVIAGIESGFCQ